jgi:CheY-like chemotaxis protein
MNAPKSDQRRVLLIDHDSRRQQLRAVALRNCEIQVHTAVNIDEAARLARANFFDLVLLAAEEDSLEAHLLCAELKKGKSRRITVLVGAPHYVRELWRHRKDADSSEKHLPLRVTVGTTAPQPTHWHVMMDCSLSYERAWGTYVKMAVPWPASLGCTLRSTRRNILRDHLQNRQRNPQLSRIP